MACPRHEAKSVPPLVQNGAVRFQAHHVGWIVCGMFTLVASVASAWLIRKHLRWYSCKPQQRHIVRLLFMVPIYAIITLASYILYTHATSLILIRDAYESVVLASFFSLLLEYLPGPVLPGASGRKRNSTSEAEKLTPSQHGHGRALSRKERAAAVHRVFYNVPMHPDPTRGKPLKWIWPLGRVKARPKDGLSYLHWMKWGVLQYCVVRPGSTLAAVILDNMNLYCEASWSWRWGHVWVVTIVSISVTVAMYCLIQLYTTISKELKPYRPLLKLFAVKAVVFLTFWQGALLSGLASLDIIKDGEYLTAEQIVIGFAALLQTFEMMCFAFLHVKAFSYVPYKRLAQSSTQASGETVTFPTRNAELPATGRRQFMNLVQAFTFTDTWRDLQAGVLYFFGRGTSRQADEACRRDEGYREVFGRERVRVRVDTITERERRSFTKIRGYKGLPEDDKAIRLGDLQYSPLTCPDDQHLLGLDDPPPASILRAGRKSRKWPASPPVSPPPRGAYVPVHGPHPSLGWEEVYNPRQVEMRNSPRRETHIPEAVTRSGLLSPVSPSRAARDLHCPIPPNQERSPGSQRSPHQPLPSPRSLPSPQSLPSPRPERRPSISDDSLLQRVFSSATRTTESRGLDSASTRSGGTRVGEFGERSSYFGSSELLSSVEDATRARVVPIRTGVPTLVPLGGSTGSSTTSTSWHTLHTPTSNQLPSPPEPARAPRRNGPNTQPRAVVLPAPLSPARYPHATWRTMTNQSSRPPAVRTQGLTHVSSVHVRPSHWSPVQSGSAGSSESGLAGRAAGRSSVGATYEPMSSLSTLSNIDDRYPDAPRNSREG